MFVGFNVRQGKDGGNNPWRFIFKNVTNGVHAQDAGADHPTCRDSAKKINNN